MEIFQKTVLKPAKFEGIGLHTGLPSQITVLPGKEDTGIVFKRVDQEKNNLVEAQIHNVCSAKLCTMIKNEFNVRVSTIEHLMAAFYIVGIDNAVVEINNQEVPIMDGSSKEFVAKLSDSGFQTQKKKRKFIKILKKISLNEDNKTLEAEPNNLTLKTTFELGYENKIIGNQKNSIDFLNDDLSDVYNSRTFCLLEDVEKIKKAGLAKGGSLENAIVVDHDRVLNEDGLRNAKEFVNHKILDLAGDFFLTGYRMIGSLNCRQGGHQLSINFLLKLLKDNSNFLVFESVTEDKKDENSQNLVHKLAVNA